MDRLNGSASLMLVSDLDSTMVTSNSLHFPVASFFFFFFFSSSSWASVFAGGPRRPRRRLASPVQRSVGSPFPPPLSSGFLNRKISRLLQAPEEREAPPDPWRRRYVCRHWDCLWPHIARRWRLGRPPQPAVGPGRRRRGNRQVSWACSPGQSLYSDCKLSKVKIMLVFGLDYLLLD